MNFYFQVYICTEGEAPTKRLKQMADHVAAGKFLNLSLIQIAFAIV